MEHLLGNPPLHRHLLGEAFLVFSWAGWASWVYAPSPVLRFLLLLSLSTWFIDPRLYLYVRKARTDTPSLDGEELSGDSTVYLIFYFVRVPLE